MADVANIAIEPNGLARTSQGLQMLERYLEHLERRSKLLNRMRISPAVELMANQMNSSLDFLKARLIELTSKIWPVETTTKPSAVQQIFAAKGTEAGATFTKAFLTAFDAERIAQKAKASLEAITVNVDVNSDSGNGGDRVQAYADGIISNIFSEIIIRSFDKGAKRIKGSLPKRGPNPTGPTGGTSRPKSFSSGPKEYTPVPHRSGNVIPFPTKRNSSLMYNFKGTTKGFQNGTSFKSTRTPYSGIMNGISSESSIMSLPKLPSSGLFKSVSKLAGKAIRPLSVVSDIASIATAKPGKERNRAIGSALGGWGGAAAGAAIGTAILPGVGTLIGGSIGGLAGSSVGEFVGEKLGKASDKIKNFFGFGHKKKKKEEIIPPPAPISSMPNPSVAAQGTFQGAVSLGRQAANGSVSINVNLPTGAVQLTVEDKLNYDEISALIGSKIATSIQQAMENRA